MPVRLLVNRSGAPRSSGYTHGSHLRLPPHCHARQRSLTRTKSRSARSDSNGDSNAPSPKVVRQRPLTREHAQNRRCGHHCWLLLISGLGVRFPRGAPCVPSERQFHPSIVAINPALTATAHSHDCQSSTFAQRPIHRVCRIAQGTRHHMALQIHRDRKLRMAQQVHHHTGRHTLSRSSDAQVCRRSWNRIRRTPDFCTRCSKVLDRFRGSTTVPRDVVKTRPDSCHESPAASRSPSCRSR